jgi:hypothetical protein
MGFVRAILCLIPVVALLSHTAAAQTTPARPRAQFVTVDIEPSRTMPLHFKEYPVRQLVGREVGADPDRVHDYRSADGSTTVDVQNFSRNTRAIGVSVYPFGNRSNTSLMLRVARETLPIIRLSITKPGSLERYSLSDGRATDFGVGVISSDRPTGWAMGVHSFAAGGVGRISGERGSGDRLFAEAGGGISFGAIGFQVGIKIAYNRLKDPRPHSFYTVPMSLRGTISF